MLNFSCKFTNKFCLKAVDSNHKINEYENYQEPYTIFNPNFNEYYIILSSNIDGNELFRTLTKFVSTQTKNNFDIDLNSFLNVVNVKEHEKLIAIVVDALEYGSVIPWTMNKKTLENNVNHNLVINDNYKNLVDEYLVVSKDKTFVRKLQDMPSNFINPFGFEKLMTEHLSKLDNVKIKILNCDELKQNNMNLLLAVGAGCKKSEDQSRLMIIEYLPNPNNNYKLGFVGKGVCFDTGGLNIKTGNYMRWMKYDMSGAAIVGSLIHSLASNKIKTNVVVAMPLVLNLASESSYRPDDVLVGHNGMSVEIDNTDAEGRLIMADSLSYLAQEFKVNELYDVATLTGAMIYALGDTYTGVWTNQDELWNIIATAANNAGELVWRLPFHHDFKDLLKSKFADIANSVSSPKGGSSRAAMFLKEFTHNLPYAHFDVAGTADKGDVGTGIMLHTFYNIAKSKQLK